MGAQYEGLVVLYNTLVASAGGRIIDEEAKKAVMDEGAVRALEQLQRFATAGVTYPVVQPTRPRTRSGWTSSPAAARSR